MRKLMLVVFLTLFCSVPVLALDAPTLTITKSDLNITLSWTSVTGATGYTLFYAPYPDASSIGQIDMGTETSISFDASGLEFYGAVQSYNSSENSGYSNIISFLNPAVPVGNDGNICNCFQNKWILTKEEQYDGSGSLTRTITYTNDTSMCSSTSYYDDSGDTYTNYYTCDNNGNIVVDIQDNDGDGIVNTIHYTTYDDNDNEVAYKYDRDLDGSIDGGGYYFSYPLLLQRYRIDDDGLVDTFDIWDYSDGYSATEGETVKKAERDSDADGSIDSIYYYTWDAQQNVIEVKIDTDADGTIDSINYLTYDVNGNYIKDEVDTDNDGFINIYFIYSWEWM